jgi:hypothetical protein
VTDNVANGSSASTVHVDPTADWGVAGRRWLTTTDAGGERYADHPGDTRLSGPVEFTAWAPPRSVQTFEIVTVTP